jgi:hypothetical protein
MVRIVNGSKAWWDWIGLETTKRPYPQFLSVFGHFHFHFHFPDQSKQPMRFDRLALHAFALLVLSQVPLLYQRK